MAFYTPAAALERAESAFAAVLGAGRGSSRPDTEVRDANLLALADSCALPAGWRPDQRHGVIYGDLNGKRCREKGCLGVESYLQMLGSCPALGDVPRPKRWHAGYGGSELNWAVELECPQATFQALFATPDYPMVETGLQLAGTRRSELSVRLSGLKPPVIEGDPSSDRLFVRRDCHWEYAYRTGEQELAGWVALEPWSASQARRQAATRRWIATGQCPKCVPEGHLAAAELDRLFDAEPVSLSYDHTIPGRVRRGFLRYGVWRPEPGGERSVRYWQITGLERLDASFLERFPDLPDRL